MIIVGVITISIDGFVASYDLGDKGLSAVNWSDVKSKFEYFYSLSERKKHILKAIENSPMGECWVPPEGTKRITDEEWQLGILKFEEMYKDD